jgi:hypothetical protein
MNFSQMHNDFLDPDLHGDTPTCEVCGNHDSFCDCPECPECGLQGDPDCYEHHGLKVREDSIGAFCQACGIEPLGALLRAIERFNTEAVDIMVVGIDEWIKPDDTKILVGLRPWQVILKLRVRGIAWDGTDWEWSEVVEPDREFRAYAQARENFAGALAEHVAWEEMEREYPPMPYTDQEAYDHENPAPLENPMDWEK